MNDNIKPNSAPPFRRASKGPALLTYWAILFKRMPTLSAQRTPLLALVATGAVAAVAIATLGVLLSSQVDQTVAVRAELSSKSDNYDSLRSDWNKQNDTISGLRSAVGVAERREENLLSAEAALTTRSSALDTREGEIKVAEDVAAANTFAGEGTFRVGVDVQPGQYTSEGGTNCYWARLNSTGDDIIDNDLASGPAVLTVQASDGLIKTSNCAPFTKTG
jgi:hypothetical protein